MWLWLLLCYCFDVYCRKNGVLKAKYKQGKQIAKASQGQIQLSVISKQGHSYYVFKK